MIANEEGKVKSEKWEEFLTQRHGGTKVKEEEYFFLLCALVPWCEVLLQKEKVEK